MSRVGLLGSAVGLWCVLGTSVALADEFSLRDGRTVTGRVIAAGPGRLLLDGSGGQQFLERAEVVSHRGDDGRPVSPPASDATDPVGVIKLVEGTVRVHRRGQELPVSAIGSLAALLEGDELRTGPYGRVQLLLPSGAMVSARDDAIVVLRGGGPELLEGTLRLEAEGAAFALVPEGRLEVQGGKVEAEHLRGRSRLISIAGRATFLAAAGYRLELPRSHVADVRAEQASEPAAVAASNTNAWPLRLELGPRRVSIQPGERVILLGIAPPAGAAPAPAHVPPPGQVIAAGPPAPASPPARVEERAAGRLVRASSATVLYRRDLPPRRLDQAEARDLPLLADDVLETEAGEVVVESGAARLTLEAGARLRVVGPGLGAPLALLSGEAVLETSERTSLGLPGGEVGLLSGRLAVRSTPREEGSARTELGLSAGTAGARFGEAVRAELLGPAQLEVDASLTGVALRVPPAAAAVPLTLGGLDLRLRPGGEVRWARIGEVEAVELGPSRIELVGGVRARIVPGPREQDVVELTQDRSRFPLTGGTYRFARQGGRLVADVPPLVRAESELAAAEPAPPVPPAATPAPGQATPAASAPALTERAPAPAAAGEERHELAGGVIVHTRGWGPLNVLRSSAEGVAIATPGGEVVLAPGATITLARAGGTTRLATRDGRLVTHEEGAGRFTARLERDGKLRLDVFSGDEHRSLEVERGVEFDLAIRADNYVLSYVFGQAVYVEAGRHVSVTQAAGLRSYMAAERGGSR